MVFSVQQIKYELLGYMKEFDPSFKNWYVGVASDPRKILVMEHLLDLESDHWIYKQALSFTAACTVQRYFLQRLKTDGVMASSGDEDLDCVYAYRKSGHTRP